MKFEEFENEILKLMTLNDAVTFWIAKKPVLALFSERDQQRLFKTLTGRMCGFDDSSLEQMARYLTEAIAYRESIRV